MNEEDRLKSFLTAATLPILCGGIEYVARRAFGGQNPSLLVLPLVEVGLVGLLGGLMGMSSATTSDKEPTPTFLLAQSLLYGSAIGIALTEIGYRYICF